MYVSLDIMVFTLILSKVERSFDFDTAVNAEDEGASKGSRTLVTPILQPFELLLTPFLFLLGNTSLC